MELNRRGYFFINGFTLIELNKGRPKGKGRIVIIGEKEKEEEKHIVEIFIKHDIDSYVHS